MWELRVTYRLFRIHFELVPTGFADPRGMKPDGVIASEAKQFRAAGATPDEIATAPAAPRNDTFRRVVSP